MDVDPLAVSEEAAWEWAARHRVPWALVHSLRRAASAAKTVQWAPQRRAFVVVDGLGHELVAPSADDPSWRTSAEAAAWRAPAVAVDPAAPVACECGLVVTHGADLALHRMGDVHRERMAVRGECAA